MTHYPDHIGAAKMLLEQQAEINALRAERDALAARVTELEGGTTTCAFPGCVHPDHQRDTAPTQPPTAPEPQTAHEISDAAIRAYAAVLIQDYAAGLDYLDLAEHLAGEDSIGGVLIADLDGPEIDDMLRRILSAAHTAEIASSWPDGRQDAPDRTAVKAAIARVRQTHKLRAEHGYATCDYDDNAIATVLDELEQR